MATHTITEHLDPSRLEVASPTGPVHAEADVHQNPQASAPWRPAVSNSKAALDEPQGWYQRTLAAEAVSSGVAVVQLAVDNLSAEERGEVPAFSRHTPRRSTARVRPLALPADSYTWLRQPGPRS